MRCAVFLVCLAICGLQAKSLTEQMDDDSHALATRSLNETISRADLRLVGSVELAETDMTALKFVAYIFVEADGTHIGNGIVVSKFYVMTPDSVVNGEDPLTLAVTVGDLDPSDSSRTNLQTRSGKELIPHPDCGVAVGSDPPNPLINCLTLLRICPSFADDYFATAPVPIATEHREVATMVNIYDYKTPTTTGVTLLKPLSKVTKHIGELCECMDDGDFDLAFHICVANDPLVYGETADATRGLIVTSDDNSAIIGFLVKEQSVDPDPQSGEIIISVGQYLQYIADTADNTPYEYPAIA